MRKRCTHALPRSKRETEGGTFNFYAKPTPPTPPSLQRRDGGVYPSFLHENDTRTPSLAPNARRRGSPLFFIRKRRTQPLPRSKRESEGFSFIFHTKTAHAPPPSLQTRAGGD